MMEIFLDFGILLYDQEQISIAKHVDITNLLDVVGKVAGKGTEVALEGSSQIEYEGIPPLSSLLGVEGRNKDSWGSIVHW